MFDKAVAAADPSGAVRRHLERSPLAPLPSEGRTYVIAIGKAAPAMLGAALDNIAGPVTALGVTHHENGQTISGAEILTAGHPVPDQAGHDATRRVISLLKQAGPGDQVLALISGGGSALAPAPVAPITLDDLQAVGRTLLGSGLNIVSTNMVRQQLSDLKGGGFLRHAAPAPVTALILSDVVGDDLRAIASGPTVSPLGSRKEALDLLLEKEIFGQLPNRVQKFLQTVHTHTPLPDSNNYLVGSNRQSLDAMRTAVPDGWAARIASDALIGDVDAAAAQIVAAATDRLIAGPTALIFGGETTVRIRGKGRGGRNQELALRVVLKSAALPAGWVFLSGGTDGRDGPTEAAGGIVDGGTLSRIASTGKDVRALLDDNASNAALDAANDLLITGATGTNVADVQVLLLP